jgi:nitrogen fixation protein FixH
MTPVPILPRPGFQVRGWHVAAGVCAFFVVVIAVDASFAVMAYRTHPGQVSVTPYEDGLLYDKHITQQRTQERLGWRAAATAAPGMVTLEFADREGRPVQGLTVTAKLERPATETGRITPKFHEAAPGRYEAPVGSIEGAWDVSAEARDRSGAVFAAERRLTWP